MEPVTAATYTIYSQASDIPDDLGIDKTGPCAICPDPINDGSRVIAHGGAVAGDRAHYDCEFYDHSVRALMGKPANPSCRSCDRVVDLSPLVAPPPAEELGQHLPFAIRHLEHRSQQFARYLGQACIGLPLLAAWVGSFAYTRLLPELNKCATVSELDKPACEVAVRNLTIAFGATALVIGYLVYPVISATVNQFSKRQAVNTLVQGLKRQQEALHPHRA